MTQAAIDETVIAAEDVPEQIKYVKSILEPEVTKTPSRLSDSSLTPLTSAESVE